MYTVDDNLMTVFAFESGSVTVYSFTEETGYSEICKI